MTRRRSIRSPCSSCIYHAVNTESEQEYKADVTLVKKKHTEEESTSKLKLYCNQQPIRMYICIHESLTTGELQQDVWCDHVRCCMLLHSVYNCLYK